ncbi:hypothetical protein A0H81_07831 [Grifola frondosa]|uniref:Uncharacterized protein n=1 Tax=Grifola frondosa TaxID=5627 RepID=A0A1C7M5E0_GRIFR|nr:hypothetical protein A0H81_07831 [Grifola frondosa]
MTTPERSQRRNERSQYDFSLLDAAAKADEQAVMLALHSGAQVNASDATGRSVVTCAIAGDSSNLEDIDVSDASFLLPKRVKLVKTLLSDDSISLFALNAPTRGVTPLGLAAWLNLPVIVQILLEDSSGLVSVDGMDSHGVTALMYAARDGRAQVVCHLLNAGARPDLRDSNSRTSIQHSLIHPRILWLCERALQRHRIREYMAGNRRHLCSLPLPYNDRLIASTSDITYVPVARSVFSQNELLNSTSVVVRAVCTSDVSTLHTLLFSSTSMSLIPGPDSPPSLVNLLDPHGWAPIHYCVCADELSIEDIGILEAFLHCDTNGIVRELRNSRGLTVLEVARPEFRAAFGMEAEHLRSVSSASVRTVRPSTGSLRSTSSLAHSHPSAQTSHEQRVHDSDMEGSLLPYRILNNLRSVSWQLAESESPDIDSLRSLLHATTESGEELLEQLRSRMHDVAEELRDARGLFNQVDCLLENVARDLEDALGERLVDYRDNCDRPRRRTTDSAGSESTAVSFGGHSLLDRKCHSMTDLRDSHGVAPAELKDASTSTAPSFQETHDTADRGYLVDKSLLSVLTPPWVRDLQRKKSRGELRVATVEDLSAALSTALDTKESCTRGPAKFKAWIRKWMKSDPSCKLEMATDLNEEESVVGRETKDTSMSASVTPGRNSSSKMADHPELSRKRQLLSMSRRVLVTASRDLSRIEGCMDTAEQFLALAAHSILQAERKLNLAISNRNVALDRARYFLSTHTLHCQTSSIVSRVDTQSHDIPTQQIFVPFPPANLRPPGDLRYSGPSLSARSSMVSLSSTLIEADDDDTHVIRRLLTRKIEARTDGAFEETDKALIWLHVVQDVLRGLRRRTRTL